MNAKIEDKFIQVLSVFGTLIGLFSAVYTAVTSKEGTFNVVVSVLLFVLFLAIIVFFRFYKKAFVDIYSICSSMALNNRLQSLREVILIRHRETQDDTNKYRVDQAYFEYVIKKSDANSYDIDYIISFDLLKPWFMRRKQSAGHRTLTFFIITLGAAPENFAAEISGNAASGNSDAVKIIPVIQNATGRGESGSTEKAYAGLYKVITILPQNIEKGTHIEFKYSIRGQIKTDQTKHSFTLIPQNYSSKINKMAIKIRSEGVHIHHPELQRYGADGRFEIAESFVQKREEISEYDVFLVPMMKSAYSIQFDLPQIQH